MIDGLLVQWDQWHHSSLKVIFHANANAIAQLQGQKQIRQLKKDPEHNERPISPLYDIYCHKFVLKTDARMLPIPVIFTTRIIICLVRDPKRKDLYFPRVHPKAFLSEPKSESNTHRIHIW